MSNPQNEVVIFLFGSMQVNRLPPAAIESIENIERTHPNVTFIVGDCKGIDLAFQRLFKSLGKDNLQVLHMGAHPRNNVNNFESFEVTIPKSEPYKSGRDYFTFKDKVMCEECDYALAVIKKGGSTGSNRNIKHLASLKKECVVLEA